ncbi:hypothetical protein [Burkholderia seminalis]|uniref:hypothetical protein n=1 Tax=Burkholderia seminalis TaxID=488731 RepID=UPI002659EEE7|nr:hypothetical protein [Burkholderia seminalis]
MALPAPCDDGFEKNLIVEIRAKLTFMLSETLGDEVGRICLLAYDIGFLSVLYGDQSAIVVGLKRGFDDAVHISKDNIPYDTMYLSKDLGRRHGELVDRMIGLRNEEKLIRYPMNNEARH